MASYLVAGCVGSWFCLRCFWFLCRAFSSVWVLVFMSGFISRMCLLCRCLFGAGCRTEAGHGAPGGCRLLPNGETSTVGSLLVDCRGCGTGPGRAARCAWLRSMCVWGDRPDGGGLSGHGPHEPGPPADLPIWSLDRGPVDRDAIVRPGPWTRGGPRGRPRMGFRVDHVFGWSAEWTVVRQGGPRDHPLHGPRSVRVVRDAGPHMGFRVGRMIGPACGPLAHSHDVVRKRAGHADGPHASTWPIRPPGPWSTVLDAGHGPHGVGMIVDRAGLDGSTVDAALRARSARPADGKGGGAVIGLRPLYRVRLCQVLFYSSCRFLVDGVVVTNGNDDDHHSNSGT